MEFCFYLEKNWSGQNRSSQTDSASPVLAQDKLPTAAINHYKLYMTMLLYVIYDLTTLCGTYSQYKHVWALIKAIHQCQVVNKVFAYHVMTLHHCPPLYTYVSACVIAKTI